MKIFERTNTSDSLGFARRIYNFIAYSHVTIRIPLEIRVPHCGGHCFYYPTKQIQSLTK